MAEYLTRDEVEVVGLNTAIPFIDSIPCNKGYIYHQSDTGIFILRGIVNNPTSCFARYNVEFTGNISIPEEGEVVPIAIALTVNGEPRYVSRAIFTPAEVEEYGNVTSTAIIKVPRCCCFSLGIESVPATTDPTVTPAPIIEVQNANLTIARIA